MNILYLAPIIWLLVANANARKFFVEHEQSVEWNLLSDLLRGFIEEKETVTVFDVDSSFDHTEFDFDDGVIQMIQAISPVRICEGINDKIVSDFHNMGDELNLPSKTKSYFAMSSSIKILHDVLHHFAKVNPNGKWVIMMVNIDHSDAENFLITAWIKHKMANILVLLSDRNSKTFVKSYNPFGLNEGQFGTFWTSEINSENLRSTQKIVDGIFRRKITNLHKYPLKASYFNDRFVHNRLLEEEMVNVFEKTLNGKFIFTESASTSTLGKRLPNGSLTGQLRAVEEGEVDIAMNNRIIFPSGTENVAFLDPISVSKLQYIVAKNPDRPHLLHFIVSQSFDVPTMIIFPIVSGIFILFWYFIEKARHGFTGEDKMNLSIICLYVVGMQSTVSMPLKKIKNQRRILVASMLLFSLIMCNAFQGMIVGLMGKLEDHLQIDTLEELLQNEYNFTAFTSNTDIFKPDKLGSNVNNIRMQIYKRQFDETNLTLENFQQILRRPKQAVLVSSEHATDIATTFYDKKTGEDLYHIVKESPISVYSSYIVPKSSPFIEILNEAVDQAVEFGFRKFIQMKVDADNERMLTRRSKTAFAAGTDSRVITLNLMRDVFALFAAGISIATVAFIAEVATAHYRKY